MRYLLPLSALLLAACGNNSGYTDVTELDLRAEPPVWSVTDADSEVILYPTVHILPAGTVWQTDTLADALGRAEEVWYELPEGAQSDPAIVGLVQQLGMSETPLSEKLSPEVLAKLEARMAEIGVPAAMTEPMQPWMAAITLPTVQLMQSGYRADQGVETVLQARDDGLGQRSFETMEQQLRFFADMPEEQQIAMLEETLDDMESGTEQLDRMAEAWRTGDVRTLEDEFIDGMDGYPELYELLIVNRNRDWAEQLDAELKGTGVDFVAVGAGHLIGPDSVPAMLASKGYDVKVLTVAD